MTPQVLQLRITLTPPDAKVEEHFFNFLVAWCNARQLFVGGNIRATVIYGPIRQFTAAHWRQLKAILDGRSDVHSYRYEFSEIRHLRVSGMRSACVEAVSQAERFLAENMADCADSLAAISYTWRRRWKSKLEQGGKQLTLSSSVVQIHMSLSRIDGQFEPAFTNLGDRGVAFEELQVFINDWTSLHWYVVENTPESTESEWLAERGPWRIVISSEPGAGLAHPEVMRRFMEWICGG